MLKKYERIVEACGKDKSLLEFVQDCLTTYANYVNNIVEMEIRVPILRARGMDVKDFQEAVERLSFACKSSQGCAVDASNMLNRFCERYGLPMFFEGDTSDKEQVADFALKVVNEFFLNGQSKTINELVQANELVSIKKEM